MEVAEPKTRVSIAILAAAGFLLGMAVYINDGLYSPLAVAFLAAAVISCALAVLMHDFLGSLSSRAFVHVLAAMVLLQMLAMLFRPPGASPATTPATDPAPLRLGVMLAAAALMAIAFGARRSAGLGFVILLMTFVALGTWKLRTAPDPKIDVFNFHRQAAEALHAGQNPYAITFSDIYGDAGAYTYGPGIAKDGRLQFGYPYPPLTLFCTAGAHLYLGDSRYAQLIAMTLTALLLVAISPNRVGMLAAALLLFTPRSFYILEMSWTEPISVMLLVATVLCMVRAPKLFPILLGLLIASKQYLPAAILLVPLVLPRRESQRAKWGWGSVIVSSAIALVVTLPMALWDIHAFWWSVVTLQTHQPYRPDSLSFLAWWGSRFADWKGPIWIAFVALTITAVLIYVRRPSFPAGFALLFVAFFAFNKQAFANYYDLVLGAISCAIAYENWIFSSATADKQIIGPCAEPSSSSSSP